MAQTPIRLWLTTFLVVSASAAPAIAQTDRPVSTGSAAQTQGSGPAAARAASSYAETELASLTMPQPPDTTMSLPAVLSAGDAVLYRRAAAAQQIADWALADRLLGAVQDRRLVGVLLAERLLDNRRKTSWEEARDWMSEYADHPDAPRIFTLAQRLKPAKAAAPAKPVVGSQTLSGSGDSDASWYDQPYNVAARGKAAADLAAKVRAALKAENVGQADRLLQHADASIPAPALDQLRAETAAFYFAIGNDGAAFDLAKPATRSARDVPRAAWIAGLASWRLGRKEQSQGYFEQVANSPNAAPWTQAAAAFWAARAAIVGKRPDAYTRWMTKAAESSYSFYGILARRALGWDTAFDWTLPPVGPRAIADLAEHPGVGRALALIQVDAVQWRARAEDELRRAATKLDTDQQTTLLTIAERGGLPGLAMRIAQRLQQTTGQRYDAGFYPLPPWRPKAGFTVDPALVYAIARLESNFDPSSANPSGASGLMQLMPGTAREVAEGDLGRGNGRSSRLFEPEFNLTLGQRLIDRLLNDDRIQGNLVHLAAAYNGGAGSLGRWQMRYEAKTTGKDKDKEDPLLFIEAIPISETRLFVERILASYWIYQVRFGQSLASLDSMVSGEWPVYTGAAIVDIAQANARN